MRRAVASGLNPRKILDAMTIFSGSSRIEGVHPLQFGLVRRKIRTQRRHGMPIVNPLVFYPWRAFDFLKVAAQWLWLVRRYRRMTARVIADPAAANYVDVALSLHTGSGDSGRISSKSSPTRFRTPTARLTIPHTHDAPVLAPGRR